MFSRECPTFPFYETGRKHDPNPKVTLQASGEDGIKSRQGRVNLAQDEILGFGTKPDQSREGRLKNTPDETLSAKRGAILPLSEFGKKVRMNLGGTIVL